MNALFTRKNNTKSIWAARLLIAIVLFLNLQASFLFMLTPDAFVPAFQLEGVPGRTAIIGYGILFLMWQVPYVFALQHPVRFRVSLWQALIMQVIGTVGESILLTTIPGEYELLRGSIQRFILFDSAGVLILVGAILLIRQQDFLQDRDAT